MMKTILALDSFKGCLTSREAVETASQAFPEGDSVPFPLSDGGEGFTECVVGALGGTFRTAAAHDPLGRPISARYGWIHGGRTAVLESAAASGLTLLSREELDPLRASSYGTGELIADAIRQGAEEIWIGLGGTAVMDAGAGMLRALSSTPVTVPIHAFYDVDVPLTGPSGAASVFGPQKGAGPDEIAKLEERFRRISDSWRREWKADVSALHGAGAAGGLGAALAIRLQATLHEGIASVLRMTGFRESLRECGMVVTGEGKADRQTLTGKAAYGVLKAVREWAPGIPVVLVAGQVEDREILKAARFDAIIQITPEKDLEENYLQKTVAQRNLLRAISRLAEDFPNLGNQQ